MFRHVFGMQNLNCSSVPLNRDKYFDESVGICQYLVLVKKVGLGQS